MDLRKASIEALDVAFLETQVRKVLIKKFWLIRLKRSENFPMGYKKCNKKVKKLNFITLFRISILQI